MESQIEISDIRLQVVYSCSLQLQFAGVLRVVLTGYLIICRLFAVRDLYLDFSSDSMPFPFEFRGL